MNNTRNIISSIISEAALDSRVSDGIIDLNNVEHVQVIAEIVYDICEDETLVNELVQTFVGEGKYPERQAYNKDGWLVTFPSKEYRDAAIKKRTHFTSDPTHGKGGMNLYYKKKGKQKRQTQQVATSTQSVDKNTPIRPKAATTLPSPEKKQVTKSKDNSDGPIYSSVVDDDVNDGPKSTETSPEKISTAPAPTKQQPSEKPTEEPKQKPTTAPAIDVPVVTTPPKQYSEVSKKFASQKRWVPTPYDEYHDAEGNVVAVVGLSGEIVPVKNTDREEYKIFAEKNMPT